MDRLRVLDAVRDLLLVIFAALTIYVLFSVLPVLVDHADAIDFFTKNCPRFG